MFLNPSVSKCILSEELKNMCGFEHAELSRSTSAKFVPNILNANAILLVYSNLVSYSLVGTSKANILTLLPYVDARDRPQSIVFPNLRYVPLVNEHITNIRLVLCDSLGRTCKFDGSIAYILHFR
jgi:hypothetical protein